MGLRINTNLPAMVVNRALQRVNENQLRTYQHLASGQRITNSGDDPAGLAIAESLRAQIRSLNQAEKNANEGISFVQVAEGGLTELSNIMIRLRELGIQAGSDTVSDRERGYIQDEVRSLVDEVNRIAQVTEFNGVPLLNGEAPKGILEFQIGIHNTENDRISFNAEEFNATASALGIEDLNYEDTDTARESLDIVDESLGKLFKIRALSGALQNKLLSTIRNLSTAQEGLTAARSRIADTDIAAETTDLVRQSVLQQAGVAVLAQANASVNSALRLLG